MIKMDCKNFLAFAILFILINLLACEKRREDAISDDYILQVTALIDGRDRLHITQKGFFWEHLEFSAVGLWQEKNEPTILSFYKNKDKIVNNHAWFPDWVADKKTISSGDLTYVHEVPNIKIEPHEFYVELEKLAGNGSVNIVQEPRKENNYEAVIDFYDSGGGAGFYTINIIFHAKPPYNGSFIEKQYSNIVLPPKESNILPVTDQKNSELHVIGVYEGTSEGYSEDQWWKKCENISMHICHNLYANTHREGKVRIVVDVYNKPIILGLSAYDPVQWIIDAPGGVKIEKVILSGVSKQRVSGLPDSTLVEVYSKEKYPCDKCTYGSSSFYSYEQASGNYQKLTGLMPSTFQGKYTGDVFRLSDGLLNAATTQSALAFDSDADKLMMQWEPKKFQFPEDELSCNGKQLVRFDKKYNLYIGLTFCNEIDGFRLYLSTDSEKSFLPAADTGGHGQDHCELVNPGFTLPNTDNINSGGCKTCATSRNLPLEYVDVWSRSELGQPFHRVQTGLWSNQTSRLKCGVSFEECFLSSKQKSHSLCSAKMIETLIKNDGVSEQKTITTPTNITKNTAIVNIDRSNSKHRHPQLLNEAAQRINKNDKVTKLNIKEFKKFLTDGQIKLLETSKDFYLDLSNNNLRFSPLLKKEYIPYPVPKNGEEVMWNHLLRFRGQEWERTTNSASYYADGGTSDRNLAREQYLFAYNDASDPIYQRLMIEFTEPPRSKGRIIVRHSFREGAETGFVAWQYLPGTRRVRRAPALGYDTPASPEGIETLDMQDMFSGPLDRYNWKLVGKKEIYIPVINKPELLRSEADVSLVDFTPHLQKEVLIVEATLKPGNEHVFSRRIFYVDPVSWNITLVEHYNSDNQLVRFSIAKAQYNPDLQSLIPDYELHFDLTQNAYVIDQHRGYKFYIPGHYKADYFTPSTLRGGGCR